MKNSISIFAAFFFGLMLTAFSTMAAPTVILTNSSNYDVGIDGRYYSPNNNYTITDLSAGYHTIGIYQVEAGGLFGINKKRTLISSSQFNLSNTNNSAAVNINVNQNGQVRINQNGYNNNNGNNGGYGNNNGSNRNRGYGNNRNRDYGNNNNQRDNQWNGKHEDDDHDEGNRNYDRNDPSKKYGNSEGKGNGHKYGHYKNKNKKQHKNSSYGPDKNYHNDRD